MMIAAIALLVVSFVLKMHEWGIYPLREMTRFLRRPWFEVVLLVFFVGGMVQYGSTKGFLGGAPSMMCSPMASVQLPTVTGGSGASTGSLFPAYTNTVTNVCFTGILPASTSVFLRAAWPSDTTLSDNALEIYARHDLATNGWEGVGTASVDAGNESVIVELPYAYLPNGRMNSMFFVLGLCTDTDNDGLSDAFERLVAQTNPSLADSDNDGMPDGWEFGMGLDPASDTDGNGATDDLDNDGICNLDEYRCGTHPNKTDTDGDGLDDRMEIGFVEELRGADFLWLDTAGHTSVLGTGSYCDSVKTKIPLPFGVEVNGVCYTNAQMDLDGLVTLINPNKQSAGLPSGIENYGGMSNHLWSATHITIAAYNTDIYAKPRVSDWSSAFTYGTVQTDGAAYSVVEYRDISQYYLGSSTTARMTLQVILPANETNVVYVSFLNVDDAISDIDRPQNFGVQLPATNCVPGRGIYANVSWGKYTGCFAQPLTLKYHLGSGTSPVVRDTDGDGLSDSEEFYIYHTNSQSQDTDGDALNDLEEVRRGTDPLRTDTDGDEMPDGWEVANGLDPRVDDSALDADSDGLSNLLEWKNGTDPLDDDTDRDGLIDSREVAWIEEGDNLVPWFNIAPMEVIEATGEPSQALYDCELPFTNWLAGGLVDLAVADVNGVVYFGNSATTNGLYSSTSGNNLMYNSGKDCALVAGYWSNLKLRTALVSKITFGTAQHGGATYFVILYENVGTYYGSASNKISFQVSVCESTPDVVFVRYGDVIDGRDGYSLSIGAQGGKDDNWNNHPRLNLFYGETPHPMSNGKTIAYHFGCGGDPLEFDTDGDGLVDSDEVAAGTNPRKEDSDGDDLDDGWEIAYGLDPLSSEGRDGAEGDFDNDGIVNGREYDSQTNPASADTDGDGLSDGEEMGFITDDSTIPWLAFDESEDLTLPLLDEYRNYCSLNWTLPASLRVQGELVTNLTVTSHGWMFLNKAGYVNPGHSSGSNSIDYYVDKNTLALAVYGDGSLLVSTNLTDRSTSVRVGTATHQGVGYAVVECVNMYRGQPNYRTNSISWQVVIPTNSAERVYVRYRDVTGEYVDGRYATVGMQSFGGKWICGYCESERGLVYEGLALDLHLGRNSNPKDCDTDGDGLSDLQEVTAGTNLNSSDMDGDSLPDGWEVRYGLDPLSAGGDDGALGDFDGDGLLNVDEHAHGTNPALADTDDDGLSDLTELGGATTNTLPWLQFETQTNLTASFGYATGSVVTWPLPEPIYLHGVCVTEVTVDSNGLVYFNRKETRRTSSVGSESRMTDSWTVNANSYTVAPYWDYLYLTEATPESVILAGTAINGTNRYLVVQYDGVCPYDNRTRQGVTNSVSWQMAAPFGDADRMYIRYSNQIGTTDGREASVGYQDFNGVRKVSYCYREAGKIFDGATVSLAVGTNTDPLNADTLGDGTSDYAVYQSQVDPSTHDADDDGLPDAEERARGTNLLNADTDGDGMTDGWEVQYGFNPCVVADADGDADNDGVSNLAESHHGANPYSVDTDGDGLADGVEVGLGTYLTNSDTDNDGLDDSYECDADLDPCHPDTDRDGLPDGWEVDHALDPDCATGDDGTNGDPDQDWLSNIDEYQNGCDPQDPDTDGDGVSDGVEVGLDSDPTDASDHGVAPPADKFRELVFNIYGDYAAWEMTIKGLGPDDTRTQVITMGAPGARRDVSKKLRKGNSYRLSMRWLNCDGHNDSQAPWYCWQALIDGLPSQSSFDDNYSEGYCARIPQRNNIVVGNGWIAENEGGLLTSHVHSSQKNSDGGSGAGNVAEGLVSTLYVLDDPKLMPDFDRDGKIDANDETLADQGRVFRFWINDDKDDDATDGKYAESPSVDIPGARTGVWEFDGRDPDWDDDEVNGWRDLIDFTPIYMDVSCIHGLPKKIRDNLTFKLRHDSEAVNVVWTDLAKTSVGMFQKGTVAVCGHDLDENSYEAETETVGGEGLEIPDALLQKMRSGSSDKCVMFVEGRKATSSPLRLDVYYGDQKIVTGELEMELSSVEAMYRLASLRDAADNPSLTVSVPAVPLNQSDDVKDLDVFFMHGFNVNAEAARAWGSEIFKRLWQSGSNARFHMLPWRGDYRWVEGADLTTTLSALHYPHNAWFSQRTGGALKRYVEAAQPDASKRILITQSLGNMVACEALREGLEVSQYYMFDAAVPSEAIDGMLRAEGPEDVPFQRYVRPEWRNYTNACWASNWHRLFTHNSNDARSRMGWVNRFQDALTNATEVFNYYSSGDSVFTEESEVPALLDDALHWGVDLFLWVIPYPTLETTFENHCWQKQEVLKGMATAAGTLSGGWGFNVWQEYDAQSQDWKSVRYSPGGAAAALANGSITNRPAFDVSDAAEMMSQNATEDDVFLALAKHVPALSSPVGGKYVERGIDGNINLNSTLPDSGIPRPNGWGRNHKEFGVSWLHSDMKDMAFFYVFKLYEQLVQKGELK